MPVKISKIQQKYLDLERIAALQNALEEKVPPDLRLDVLIALSLLKDCFKYGFIERID